MRNYENNGYDPYAVNNNSCAASNNVYAAQNNCTSNNNTYAAQNNCATNNNAFAAQNNCATNNNAFAAQSNCATNNNAFTAQNSCGCNDSALASQAAQNSCGCNGSTSNGSALASQAAQNSCGCNGSTSNGSTMASQMSQSPCQELYLAPNGTICRNGEPLAQNYNQRCTYQCITPAFFNGIYNGGNQDVAPNGEVCFLQAYQTGDFQFTPNTPCITCKTSGIYRIDYTLSLRPAVGQINATYAIDICGKEHPYSCFGLYLDGMADEERQELCGSFLTNLCSGETLVLKNKSNTCSHLSSCTPVSQTINRASIIIQRVA
jgi:hypothetical protein